MAGPGTARAQGGDYQPAAGSRDLAAALGFGEPLSGAEEARYLKAARWPIWSRTQASRLTGACTVGWN